MAKNKYQAIREENIAKELSNVGNPGSFGRAFEIMCASEHSRKVTVAKQGEPDLFIKYGKGTVKAECKTSGGRIGSLLNGENTSRFVVYEMDFVQKHKACKSHPYWEETRHIEPVLIPKELFLAKLNEFGIIKSTNGDHPEPAIQVSSKVWYEWLQAYPVEYHSDWTYEPEDFEGLE